jgi:hypothetical protein
MKDTVASVAGVLRALIYFVAMGPETRENCTQKERCCPRGFGPTLPGRLDHS